MAAETLTYPTPMELREVEQNLLPTIVEDDPVFSVFPIVETANSRVRWRQKDDFTGLQQIRGLNGQPRNVRMVGYNEYEYKPGVYGEFVTLDEDELTERGAIASYDEPMPIDDMVSDAQTFLLQRRIDRIRYIIFTLLTTGTFSVPNGRGEILHYDTFNLLALTAGVPWSTVATAVPMANIRAAQQLSLGQSVSFGEGAEMWMNQVTLNNLLSNNNANDFFGKRVGGGNTVNEVGDINRILLANGLPTIVVYDRVYKDDSGTVQKFIPNGKVILIGRRTNNAKLGEYRMTRNAVNPKGEPGAYTRVIDRREREVPGGIDVHDGHNGGPIIWFPGAIVVLSV